MTLNFNRKNPAVYYIGTTNLDGGRKAMPGSEGKLSLAGDDASLGQEATLRCFRFMKIAQSASPYVPDERQSLSVRSRLPAPARVL